MNAVLSRDRIAGLMLAGMGLHRSAWRLLAVLAGVVGLAIPAFADLTVATYNLENYTLANRMVDGVYRKNYPKPEKERAALRQVVAAIAPDVLAVQEMGPQAFLDDFQRELKQDGLDYPYAVLLEAADADRHVAVLSKVPFKAVRPHGDLRYTFFGQPERVRRGALEVVISTDVGDVSLFVLHLKSKYTERETDPESAQQRAREAELVRDLVLTRFPDPTTAKYLVCGDWNDTRGSRPIRALQKRGDTVIGTLVDARDSRGETWTHYFQREDLYSRIDYLMVSPGLKVAVPAEGATIHDGAGAAEASDHRAVWVRLDINPTRSAR